MSLRLKMIVGIGAILLAVMLIYAIIAVRSHVNHLRDLARREAELIAVVAERSIARAMLEGKSNEVQALLEKIGEEPHLVRIRIVDPQGVVLRSDKPEEMGKVLRLGDEPIQAGLPGPVWDYRAQTVGVFRPISNGPRCHACHSGEQPVLGFLNASVSFPGATSEVARNLIFVMLPAVLALSAAGVFIAVYFALAIGRRIDSLSKTMRHVEAGNLGVQVIEDDGDELGRLGKSFNAMVSRLAEAKRQLEDRHAEEVRRAEHLASLGKIAAGIAHEINNPIAGMQNCVKTLLKWVGDNKRQVEYLEMLEEGLGRISRTVRQLLDFAREAKPRMTPIDLTLLLRKCLALLEHQLAVKKISSSLSVSSPLPELFADPQQLEQVFLNFLMNALEAMPGEGSLMVTAGTRQQENGLFVEVTVADTGVGIPSFHLPRIFDPFFTTKEVGKGTGLGLSVSYGIVMAHGGSIEVQSEVGRGTTFTVLLPVERDNDAVQDSPGRR